MDRVISVFDWWQTAGILATLCVDAIKSLLETTRRLNQKNLLEKCPPVGPVKVAGPSFRGKGDGQ